VCTCAARPASRHRKLGKDAKDQHLSVNALSCHPLRRPSQACAIGWVCAVGMVARPEPKLARGAVQLDERADATAAVTTVYRGRERRPAEHRSWHLPSPRSPRRQLIGPM
jgi:hypothetical protein